MPMFRLSPCLLRPAGLWADCDWYLDADGYWAGAGNGRSCQQGRVRDDDYFVVWCKDLCFYQISLDYSSVVVLHFDPFSYLKRLECGHELGRGHVSKNVPVGHDHRETPEGE